MNCRFGTYTTILASESTVIQQPAYPGPVATELSDSTISAQTRILARGTGPYKLERDERCNTSFQSLEPITQAMDLYAVLLRVKVEP